MSNIEFSPNIQPNTTLPKSNSDALHHGRTVKVATLNIDTNLLLETKYSKIFPEYTAGNRIDGIKIKLNGLQQQETDIICIQEGRTCTEGDISIDSVTPVVNFLQENGYNTAKVHYNNSGDKAFQFITALNSNKFKIISNTRILLSKDGKDYPNIDNLSAAEKKEQEKAIKEHYLDQAFARSFFLTETIDINTNKKIFIANIHLGVFPETHKNKAITHTIKYLAELYNNNPDSIIIIAGDFNSFPDMQGIEQIKMLHDANFTELSKTVVHPDGEKFIGNSSFIAFPYDYAAYNNDTNVKTSVAQAKQILQESQNNDGKENSTKLTEARNKLITTFQMTTEQAKKLWEQEKNETNSKSLYPLGGQLDHILVMAKKDTFVSTEQATIQLMDTQGDVLDNNKDSIVEHMQNSLQTKTAPFATDHQGLVASMTIL